MSSVPLALRDWRPTSKLVVREHLVERARFAVVDAHNHLGRWLSEWIGRPNDWTVPDVGELIETMDACNVRAIVSMDGRWGEELEANRSAIVEEESHLSRAAIASHDATEGVR